MLATELQKRKGQPTSHNSDFLNLFKKLQNHFFFLFGFRSQYDRSSKLTMNDVHVDKNNVQEL